MGAITASVKKRGFLDAGVVRIVDVTGSSSYATGGDTYVNSNFELAIGADIIIDAGTPGYVLVPDIPNKKIKYFKGAAGLLVEETAATNLSAVTGRVLVIGDEPYV